MPTITQDAVVAAIRELHVDVSRLAGIAESILGDVRGLYRRSGSAPRQPEIPGLAPDDTRNDAPDGHFWTMPPPGEIARSLPRRWCNTVKVYEALWEKFNDWEDSVPMAEVFKEDTLATIAKKTSRPIQPQTVARMMTALRRAGAIRRDAHNRHNWFIFLPTDALREAVEREANRMNARRPARGEPSSLRTFEPSNRQEAARA